jgi:hypothetical protein
MSPSALLQHFKRVSWRDTGCLIPDWDPDLAVNTSSPFDNPFSLEELDAATNSMRLKAAPGPNGLSPGLIKEIFKKPNGQLYLLRLFNRYFIFFSPLMVYSFGLVPCYHLSLFLPLVINSRINFSGISGIS